MSFLNRIPDFVDVFLGYADVPGGIAFPEALDRSKLDFSHKSLHAVDRYLDVVHKHNNELSDEVWMHTVVAAGSYLGEVIRRHSPRRYHWSTHEEDIQVNPGVAGMLGEPYIGTEALLVGESGGMTMPINKVVRYIEEGPENNTHFYAGPEINP